MIKFYRALESSLRSSVAPYFAEGAPRVTPVHSRHAVLSHDVHAVTPSRRPNQELPLRYAKSARVALRQIATKGYAKPYAADKRPTVSIGINYNPKTSEIELVVEPTGGPVNQEGGPVKLASGPVKLLDTIQSHPGLRKGELSMLSGMTERSIKRYLTILGSKVEFRGAPKNGGYYSK